MYNLTDKMYIWLDSFGLSYKKKESIINLVGDISVLFEELPKYREVVSNILSPELANKIYLNLNDSYLNSVIKKLDDYNIYCVTKENDVYPDCLRNLAGQPFCLYTKGEVKLLNKKCIGIVGTRRPSRYGRDMAEMFTKKLIQSGMVAVSGLAFGIDTCVAATSVNLKLPTIAVLAGGLDSIYPIQNYNLSEEIISCGGLLVSEYPPLTKPTQYAFLERNRIVSGISLGVLVIEAGKRSGACATAMDAVEQGKELFVLPGNINSETSEGCNNLIYAMPEAFCISPEQILKAFKITPESQKNRAKSIQLSIEEKLIIDAIGDDEISLDDLAEKTKLDIKILMVKLTTLEISGIIKKLTGNYYAKISLPN